MKLLFFLTFISQQVVAESPWEKIYKKFQSFFIKEAPLVEIVLPIIPQSKIDPKLISNKKNEKADPFQNLSPQQKNNYYQSFLNELFYECYHREFKYNSNKESWFNILSQGASYEAVYRGIILGDAYYSLETKSFIIKEDFAKIAQDFFKKYTRREIALNRLMELNFFSLKRNLVEKLLETFDFLMETDSEKAYDWYAVLSQELAQNYTSALSAPLRNNSSAHIHRNWAKKVSLQQVKAELIIKMHKILNSIYF